MRALQTVRALLSDARRQIADPLCPRGETRRPYVSLAAGILLPVITCELLESVMCAVLPRLYEPFRMVLHVLTALLVSSPMLYLLVLKPFRTEIRARGASEESLCRSRDHMLRLLDALPVHVWRLDASAHVDYVNRSFLEFGGQELGAVVGQGWAAAIHPDDERLLPDILASFHAREPFREELRIQRADGVYRWLVAMGSPITDHDDRFGGYIGVCIDITEQKDARDRLNRMAYFDELTRLPNRALFKDRLAQSIALARRQQRQVAVALLDLDGFKEVNDSLGHDIGDHLLQAVANRLTDTVRESDSTCRIGGDEFVIILADLADSQAAESTARRIHESFQRPFHISGHELYVSASIGISVFPSDGADSTILLKNADMAMYYAKEHGKSAYHFFSDEMNAKVTRRAALSHEMRRAVKRHEFVLHYQPQVELDSGVLVGAEALIRWNHPKLGPVAPAYFIELAEELGVICEIDDWVLLTACKQVAEWHQQGAQNLRVSVNVSPKQFQRADLLSIVADALSASGLPPEYLELEITERTAMQDTERTLSVLREFNRQGVRIAIDDFGTGYSSLAYLKRFPISTIKIDGSFIRDIPLDQDDVTIVSTIIAMAKSLRVKVVGEAVETREQLDLLSSLHCDIGQGYLLGTPVPADTFREMHVGGSARLQTADCRLQP